MKIRESYGSRRYEEEYRAALEKSVHYFRQNSCITELRKMGYAQTKLQKNLLQKMIFRSVKM